MTKKYLTIPAVVAGALGISGTVAWAAEPTTDELLKQIEQLQGKVEQLEAKQTLNASGSNQAATVDQVLRDAEKRSQLLQAEGFTSGWDNGFWIRSGDGNYSVNPYFQFQFRHVINHRDDVPGGDDDSDTQHGFEVRRAKFGVKGTMFTPEFTYNLRWETDSDGGGVTLEEASVQYYLNDDWAVMLGQFKDAWTHEETVSSGKQLAVDRSLLNELLGGGVTDYVQGVSFWYAPRDANWRAMVSLHDGFDTDNTNFIQHQGGGSLPSGSSYAPNHGFSGRVEYLAMGNWKSYEDFTAMGNTEDLLVFGAGGDWTQDGGNDIYFHTVDVQWEDGDGRLGVYGAYVGAFSDLDTAPDDTYDWGFLVQAGYMLNDQWEVFGRWDMTFLDDALLPAGADDEYTELTVGVNYYMQGHRAKFTVDAIFLPDGSPGEIAGIGVLDSDDESQFAVRAQFQLLL